VAEDFDDDVPGFGARRAGPRRVIDGEPGGTPEGPAVDYALGDDYDDELDVYGEDSESGEALPGAVPAPRLQPHGDQLAGPAALESAEEAFVDGQALPPRRLFSFYDRLRDRVAAGVERRGGKLGRPAADALLLVPDVFMLLARLAFDRQVPPGVRSLIGGALAYFVLPFDLLPEGLIGGAGFLDDLVLATAVLSQALSPALAGRAERYWSGRQELRQVLQDVVATAHSLLGENLFARLRALLARRGVLIPAQHGQAGDPDLAG
jgi:uncharacterized membrane protein YkvA (DUF1232 family)